MSLSGKVLINEQEDTGDYDFSISEKYMTTGFQNAFGKEAVQIAFTAVSLIMEKYPSEADYFQTFQYVYPDGKTTDFWIIHDCDYYTVLLPEEYQGGHGMKWFKEITTLKELRKEYRRLVLKHHPDNGGNEDVIKEINAEYDRLFKKLKYDYEHEDTYSKATDKQKQQYDWQKDAQIREAIMQLSRFKDITVEVIGVWIWVSDCYPYRKELKELGFRWASQKQMWYKHFDDFHKFSSRPASMSYIRAKYGSVEIKFKEKQETETEKLTRA